MNDISNLRSRKNKSKFIKVIAFLLSGIMFILSSSVCTIPAYAALAKTSITKVTSPKAETVKVTVKKVSGVTGYQVQYATNKSFTKNCDIFYIDGSTTGSYNLFEGGKTYYVRARSYKSSSDYSSMTYSSWSSVKSVKVKSVSVKKPTSLKAKITANGNEFLNALEVTFKKQSGTNGCQIQYATNKKFTKNKTTKTYSYSTSGAKSKSDEITLKDLKSKTKYYIRVRTYKNTNSGKVWSKWSSVTSCTTGYSVSGYINTIIKSIGITDNMTDLEKLARVQSYFNRNYKYGSNSGKVTFDGVTFAEDDISYECELFAYKKGTSSQFATVFEAFMDLLDIKCRVVGKTGGTDYNLVRLDGSWYVYDSTPYDLESQYSFDTYPEISTSRTGVTTTPCYRNFVSGSTSAKWDSESKKLIKKYLPAENVVDINNQQEALMYTIAGLDRDTYIANYVEGD